MPDRARRRRVAERAGWRCEYCRSPDWYSFSAFDLDHIFPSSRDGQPSDRNLAYSCGGCNNLKSDFIRGLDLQTNTIVPLFNPREHVWRDHFQWSVDGLRMEALTGIGRATIRDLELNRDNLIRVRRLLIPAGEHPPPEDCE